MDARHLFHPKPAGDITVGAKLVSYTQRGDGPELTLLEVLDAHAPERSTEGDDFHPDDLVTLIVRSPHGGDPYAMVLKAATPIIITGIVP